MRCTGLEIAERAGVARRDDLSISAPFLEQLGRWTAAGRILIRTRKVDPGAATTSGTGWTEDQGGPGTGRTESRRPCCDSEALRGSRQRLYLRKALTVSSGSGPDPSVRNVPRSGHHAGAGGGVRGLDAGATVARPIAEELGMQIGVAPEVAVSLMDQRKIDRILTNRRRFRELECLHPNDQRARQMPFPVRANRYRQE